MNSLTTIAKTFFIMEVRNKQALIMGTLFPVMMLLLMGIAGREESRESMSYMSYILPGILGMAYAATGLIAMPIMLSSYRENGFLLYIKVTPVKVIKLITALIITQLIIMLIQTVLLLGVCNFALGLDLNYSLSTTPYVIVGLFLSAVSLVCVGFVISIFCKSVKNTTTIGNLSNLILSFLGGAFFPTDVWPSFMQPLVKLNPITHMVAVLRKTLLFDTYEVRDIYEAYVWIMVVIVVMLVISVRKFSYEII